ERSRVACQLTPTTARQRKDPGLLAKSRVILDQILARKGDLLDDLRDPTGADRSSTFTDCELELFLHSDRLDELHGHVGVVARHDHIGALRKVHHTSHISRTEVELR